MANPLFESSQPHAAAGRWHVHEMVAGLLAATMSLFAFWIGSQGSLASDPYRLHAFVLVVLVILQTLVVYFSYIARLHSTWKSGVYEWLVCGSLFYFIHSICAFRMEYSTDPMLEVYSDLALLMAMACFLVASVQVRNLARRYGFLNAHYNAQDVHRADEPVENPDGQAHPWMGQHPLLRPRESAAPGADTPKPVQMSAKKIARRPARNRRGGRKTKR